MGLFVDKVNGNTVDATEYNALVRACRNTISSTGVTPIAGSNTQVSRAISQYCAVGDYYSASGTANAIVLTNIGSLYAPTSYQTGFRARFKAGSLNTSTTTANVGTLGVKNIKKINSQGIKSDLSGGEIIANRYYNISYDGTDFILSEDVLNTVNQKRDLNLTSTNNSSNPNYQIDIAADYLTLYDIYQNSIVLSSITQTVDLSASGAGGLDTGSEASDTWYYYYVIYNPTTGTTSSLFSTSPSSPTLPSGYTFFRRVNGIRNNASSNLKKITQTDDIVVYEYSLGGESPDYRVDSNVLYASGNVTIDSSAFYPNSIAYEMGLFVSAVGNSTTQLSYQTGLSGFTANTRLDRIQTFSSSSATLRVDGSIRFYTTSSTYDRSVSATGGSFGSWSADITWYRIKL